MDGPGRSCLAMNRTKYPSTAVAFTVLYFHVRRSDKYIKVDVLEDIEMDIDLVRN